MRRWITLGMLAGVMLLSTSVAQASHSWGTYHWARTSNPFTLKLGDNLSSTWDPYLVTASSKWSESSVLDTTIVAGNAGSPRRCRATLGRDEVCNAAYGFNGWLGVAQIWIYSDGHIAQGVVKLNDSYFNTSTYNTAAWRQFVMCQEVGHTFGLDHQDEIFDNTNLGSCMDYTAVPAGPPSNEHPNQHDYDQLAAIYAHLDETTTVASAKGMGGPQPVAGNHDDEDLGTPTGKKDSHGRDILFVKHLGGGQKLYTWVNWAGHGNPDKP